MLTVRTEAVNAVTALDIDLAEQVDAAVDEVAAGIAALAACTTQAWYAPTRPWPNAIKNLYGRDNRCVVRLLRVVITALWLCVAVGLVFAAEWVNAFGPAYLTDHWTIVVLRLGLWAGALSALGHRVFHHPTWINILSALVMVFASIAVMLGVQAVVFSERGSTTVCTVLGVDERKEYADK